MRAGPVPMPGADRDLIVRYGTTEPPAVDRAFECGGFSFTLENGAIRWLKWDGVEILRGIAFLLRDRNWGTPVADLDPVAVEADATRLSITFTGRVACDRAVFEFAVAIRAEADGRFSFAIEGQPSAPLMTNRCGLVMLHPADFAGIKLEIEHLDGSREVTEFPRTISPAQPAFDIRAFGYALDGGPRVHCRIDASLPARENAPSEMEDQRNWSDASYKTYVGSLLDPWPYQIQSGFRIRQRVDVVVEPARTASLRSRADATLHFAVGSGKTMPPIGIGFDFGQPPCDGSAAAALEALSPQNLVLIGHLHGPEFEAKSAEAARLAQHSGATVELQLILPSTGQPQRELQRTAAILARVGLSPKSVLVCPDAFLKSFQPSDTWPDLPPLETYYRAAREAFPNAEIGGGMVTFFTELNRKRPTGSDIDYISHTTSPIIHAADDASVMESLQSLPAMAQTVAAVWPRLRYRVGPSSIALRSNPYGMSCVANPQRKRLPLSDDDPRQRGLFAAAWSVGYAAALADFALDGLSLHDLTGPLGILSGEADRALWTDIAPGAVVRPVFHVLRALAGAAGRNLLPSTNPPAGIAAIGWQTGTGAHRALVANLRSIRQTVALPAPAEVLVLDSASFSTAVTELDWTLRPGDTMQCLELEPCAVGFLHG
jgi:hypothetical protein